MDVRDLDVRWVDTSLHGESAHARYFARTPSELALPVNAPELAFDDVRTTPVVARVNAAVSGTAMMDAQPRAAFLAGGFRGQD